MIRSSSKTLLLIIVGFLSFSYLNCTTGGIPVQPVRVEGIAMEPTLKNGDRIIINRSFDKLERGDIVIFYHPNDQSKSFIKRIVGLPNDEVEIREGKVLINGQSLDEPYVSPENNQSPISLEPVKVPEASYYVVGDNRDHSNDSRFWGALQRNFIYGKFIRKY